MDESRAAECCICHHTSDWFYDDISVLQSKHSQRSIRVVLKLIMGEELIQDWAASNTMCFECVDKINDYDEAFEKMQSIERELKQIYQSIDVKIETEDGTVYGVSTVAESNEHDTEQFDANHLSENFYDPLHARIDKTESYFNKTSTGHFECPNCRVTFSNTRDLEAHIVSIDCGSPDLTCLICHEGFTKLRYLRTHMLKHDRKDNLDCEFCGIVFDVHEELAEHKAQHSSRPNYQCLKCDYMGKTTKLLKQHVRIHIRGRTCQICNRGFMCSKSLEVHLEKHEAGEIVVKVKDPNCDNDSGSNKQSDEPQLTTETEQPPIDDVELQPADAEKVDGFSCRRCGTSYRSLPGLLLHETRIHGETAQCTTCHTVFKNKTLLERHMAEAKCKILKVQCSLCPKRYTEPRYLKTHIKVAHKISLASPLECDMCGVEYDTFEELGDHQKLHSGRPEHQCLECDYCGQSAKLLKQHMRSHIKKNMCDVCNRGFGNETSLEVHIKHHDRILSAQCYICKQWSISTQKLRDHMRMKHTGEKPFVCSHEQCGRNFASKEHLNNHASFHSEVKLDGIEGSEQFVCPKCGKTYQTARSLMIHNSNMHKTPGWMQCSLCPAKFSSKKNLKLHEERHLVNNMKAVQVECDQCGLIFSNMTRLKMHISKFHKEAGKFECSKCLESFPNSHVLKQHMAFNVCRRKTVNFRCRVCDKIFLVKRYYKSHMKSHNVSIEMEPPFDCDYCGFEMDSYNALCEHQQLHLNRPEFECVFCDYKPNDKQRLRQHTRKHGKITYQQHVCDICGRVFKGFGLLKVHLRYHTDDLNFECYICKFRTLNTLKVREHMRKHTGEKPFACPECGKMFSRKMNRNTHLKLHFGPSEKPHKCTVCDAAFARTGKLSEHYLKAHGLNIKPNTNRLIKVNR